MFKLRWGDSGAGRADADDGAAGQHPDKLRLLCEHFPIGKKIRYFPEYQRDIVFQTIVVAYRVNDEFLYSREAIRCNADGDPVSFVVGARRSAVPIGRVGRLQILVPDTSDMERSLDYVRRASLGRNGQFGRGNTITLISETCQAGIPSIDTLVDARLKLKDGPYMGNQMVLLQPDLKSLVIVDQRKNARVRGDLPVSLYLGEDHPPHGCILGDFSDQSMRLRIGPGMKAMPEMAPDDPVTVVFSFGSALSTYRIRGTVYRPGADACVIKLDRLYKGGEFAPLNTMDILEIKTGLLNLQG